MVETRTLRLEKEHQEKAFEYYYSLGSKRSYNAVAKKFGVSPSAVKLWGRSFHWKARVAERDAQIAREIANQTISDELSRRKRNLKIVEMSLVQLAKGIAQGKVKMTMADLDKLVRLEAFLSDQPDSRQEVIFGDLKNKSREELREMMRKEMEALRQLEASDSEIEEWEREKKLLTRSTTEVNEVDTEK